MASEVLDLFVELAGIASPSGEERQVADRVTAYLRDCGLRPDEDETGPSVGSTMGNIHVALEPTTDGRAGVPLRPPRHGAADRRARAGRRGRDRPQRPTDDPRRRQQGRRRRDARGDAPRARREPAACRHRAALHVEGGGRAARRLRLRPQPPAVAGRLRLRPGGGDRRDHPRRPLGPPPDRHVPRPRRTRRDVPGGRAVGDRRRGARDRRDAPGPDRRARPRRTSARSAAARRRTSSRSGARSSPRRGRTTSGSSPTRCRRCRMRSPSRPASPSARSRRTSAAATAATGSSATTSRCGSPPRPWRAAASSRATACRAGPQTPTCSTSAASSASTSPTGWRRSTRPTSRIAVADLDAMVEVTLALVDAAAA